MKGILCLLFGLVLAAGSASGQVISVSPLSDSGGISFLIRNGYFRVMAPDRMPCLVPDLVRVERMPVRRTANADPMPNGFRPEREWSIEIIPGVK
jgi:hypothetical protein